jgi:nicotinate-nucleotide--dimethylbenzimidazole phosphoribosyltransferase
VPEAGREVGESLGAAQLEDLERLVERVKPADTAAMEASRLLHDRLTKPKGALGQLEEIGTRLAAMKGAVPPPVPTRPAVLVFAADHGVVEEGVTPWPQEVTGQMVANFLRKGAAINAIASTVGAEVFVVDVGVATDTSSLDGLIRMPVAQGTRNLAREAAMTPGEALKAVAAGAAAASLALSRGYDLLCLGEMGIGNTTAAACVVGAVCEAAAEEVTGRGTGIDDATYKRKVEVVRTALRRFESRKDSIAEGLPEAVLVLSEVGGFEIGAIAGAALLGASVRVPVVLDGVISLAGGLIAAELAPACVDFFFAGHLSVEPGAAVALRRLGLAPILSLAMRLGEGTGAALAVPLIQAGARVLNEMATFDSAGVAEKPQ